jgi:hypothetical protein
LALTPFDRGKLKIAAHVREEMELAGLMFDSILCKSGGIQTHPDTARLTVWVRGNGHFIDLTAQEVEDCEFIVAGEVWHRIAKLLEGLRSL